MERSTSQLIDGVFETGAGAPLESRNPARPSECVWSGNESSPADVERAIGAARRAAGPWARMGFEARAAVLREAAKLGAARVEALAAVIRAETGKPGWDAKAEASLIASKIDITLDTSPSSPLSRVTGGDIALGGTKWGRTRFQPHGVMAVLGPFNFPMHLPNGHIAPALAMGNTVVFKPSDKTPRCGVELAKVYAEALEKCGAPRGVVNLVQGGPGVAGRLAGGDGVDGVLFTGSWPVGRRIMEANLDRPGRMLALEMGGNNGAVIMGDADLTQAVIECVRSAFISSGQRCTCTRRLIVQRAVAARVIGAIAGATAGLVVGDPAGETFMGPVISRAARDVVLEAQRRFVSEGAEIIVEARVPEALSEGWYVSPGVLRVDRFTRGGLGAGADVEVFGPLLRVSVVDSLDEAIEQCNATEYGLAASIFTRDERAAEEFASRVRAGCINWNCGTAGASSKLPFGGLGLSGNHRPAGAFSLDYCAYPVAGMIERGSGSTMAVGMPEIRVEG